MKQKGNVVLIVLLIALAIGGYFYFGKINLNKPTPQQTTQPSPSPVDETSNWKTYTNTKYGYSIKYPLDWQTMDITNEPVVTQTGPTGPIEQIPLKDFMKDKFQEDIDSIITFLSPQDIDPVVPKKGPGGFWISGIRLEVKKGTQSQEVAKYDTSPYPVYQSEATIIDGLSAVRLTAPDPRSNKKTFTVILERNGLVYKITNAPPGRVAGSEEFNQILSTFKFTK